MNVLASFIANGQPTELVEPGHGAFDDPAMASQPLARFLAFPRDPDANATSSQMPPATQNVIRLIRMQLVGSHPALATRAAGRRDRINQFLKDDAVMPVGAGDLTGEWRAAAVGNKLALRAGRPLGTVAVCRVRPGRRLPFLAGILALSTQARSQSIWPACPSSSSSARWKRSQMPDVCQSRSRRQQVMPLLQPNSCGSISHGIPLRRTKTIPVRQARSGSRGRPPFGCGGFRWEQRFNALPECVRYEWLGHVSSLHHTSRTDSSMVLLGTLSDALRSPDLCKNAQIVLSEDVCDIGFGVVAG